MSQAICQFQVDSVEKANAFAIIESYGMTPSEVFRLFLKQINQTKTIPLSLGNTPTTTSPSQSDPCQSDIVDFVMTLPPAQYSETGLAIQHRVRDEWL